jgi:hypothetical protein
MMKMMALALAATAGVQAANTSRRQMQDACADLTGDGVVAVADLLALLAGASISLAPPARATPPARPRTPEHRRTHEHRRAPACRCGVPGRCGRPHPRSAQP